jgi:hypothetical protein
MKSLSILMFQNRLFLWRLKEFGYNEFGIKGEKR